MALLEYVIEYEGDKATVTCKVVEVDHGDRIRYTSSYKDTGIEYVNGSPFSASDAPQAGKTFLIGAATTPEFRVTRNLNEDNKLHFNCGEVVRKKMVGSDGGETTVPTMNPWGSGSDTPSN